VLARLPAHNVAVLTGKQFFPHLISAPFHHGLEVVFTAAIALSIAGALISLLRGRQFYYEENGQEMALAAAGSAAVTTAAARTLAASAPAASNGSKKAARAAANGSATASKAGANGDSGHRSEPASSPSALSE
jgi:hypothetical protein